MLSSRWWLNMPQQFAFFRFLATINCAARSTFLHPFVRESFYFGPVEGLKSRCGIYIYTMDSLLAIQPLLPRPWHMSRLYLSFHAFCACSRPCSLRRFVVTSPVRFGGHYVEGHAGEPAAGLSHVLATLQGVPREVGANRAVRRLVAHAAGGTRREFVECSTRKPSLVACMHGITQRDLC